MLIEIQSDVFKSNGQIRPAIRFHQGVNVVKGPDDFVNSIGKSTFLMIVDFVFGGNDYVEKLKNVSKYIGPHEINFTFEFADGPHYFCRSTTTSDIVNICTQGYAKTSDTMSINDFNKWLKDEYGIGNSLTFRSIVSRFFRIYNRENLNELLPLRTHNDETEGKSIESVIKLFDLYGTVEQANQDAKEAEDRKVAFTGAQKYEYIPKINKTKYKENLKRIAELEAKELELAEKSSKDILDLDSEKAAAISELKGQLSTFRRQRGKLYTQLDLIKKDKEMDAATYQGDFSVLKEFFPDVNEDRLKTVETFHKDISSILEAELKDSEKKTWNLINLLNSQIKSLESQIDEVQNANAISKVVFEEYSRIDRELSALKRENEYFDKLSELNDDYKSKSDILTGSLMIQAGILQERLNGQMSELNCCIFGRDVNSPRIAFISPKSYEFYTPDDDGTGTNYKGMIVLDLACLSLTCLPALIHDSVLLKQISKASTEKIFELYSSTNKQIFVAFDNLSSYSDRTAEIVNANVVLSLSGDSDALFGMKFGEQKEN